MSRLEDLVAAGFCTAFFAGMGINALTDKNEYMNKFGIVLSVVGVTVTGYFLLRAIKPDIYSCLSDYYGNIKDRCFKRPKS